MVPIRWKITAASTAATMLLLVGAGLIFLTTLHSGLQDSLDNSLRSGAQEIAAQLNPDGTVRVTSAGGQITLAEAASYGQLLSASGTVLLSTSSVVSKPLLPKGSSVPAAGRFFDLAVDEPVAVADHHELRVLTVPLGDKGLLIAVGASRDIVDEAIERAGKQLLLVGFGVLVVAALGSWLLARTALRPVDRMRAQAAELQAADAAGGLDVPGSRDEIGRLASTLNGLLSRLHTALERERAFVADAGHELRTPLTVLRGELELARRPGRSRDELIQTVLVASEETERLIRLAEDLLVLARDESPDGLTGIDFDLMQLIDSARSLLAGVAATQSVRIEVAGPDRLAAHGDPDRIRQALDNVLSNAMKFSPVGGQIVITAASVNGQITVDVGDDGPGFAPDLLPHAFERFRRGDVSRARGVADPAGTGLGLAIVRAVLRSHGGDAVAANRADGPGALVSLRWPG